MINVSDYLKKQARQKDIHVQGTKAEQKFQKMIVLFKCHPSSFL